MIDDIDRASEREAEILADALRDHHRRAGLGGKTAADSAMYCGERSDEYGCGELIPAARRRALPGCGFCVECQRALEIKNKGEKAR